jgi:hypothetical protein
MGTIITISREYGAGGTSIGKRVAQELGIELYDRDIIRSTVLKTGLDAGVIEHEEEEISRGDAFLRMITPAAYVDRREVIREIDSVLDKPPRNCDVGTAEEQSEGLWISAVRGIVHRTAKNAKSI